MKLALLGWRTLLFLIVFEGALRKWILPQASTVIYLLKDLVLVAILINVFLGDKKWRQGIRFHAWRLSLASTLFTVYAFIVAMQAFNANLPNVLLGLWGLKTHLLYAGMLFVVPYIYNRYPTQLWKDVQFLLWAGLAVALLGIAQFSLPQDHLLNQYATDMVDAVATFGDEQGKVRITGTFPYITGMTTFMFVVSLLALSLIMGGKGVWNKKYFALIVFSVAIIGSGMTGGRWGLYVYGIVLPLVAVLYGWAKSRRLLVSMSLISVALLSSSIIFDDVTSAFLYRASSAGDDQDRVSTQLFGFSRFVDNAGVIGYGAGSTYQAAPLLVPGGHYEWLKPIVMSDFEDEPSRVMVELGALGFVSWLAMKILLVIFGWRIARSSRHMPELPVAVWSVGYLAAMLTSSVIFNPTANFFYWYAVSLLIYIDHQYRMKGHMGKPVYIGSS